MTWPRGETNQADATASDTVAFGRAGSTPAGATITCDFRPPKCDQSVTTTVVAVNYGFILGYYCDEHARIILQMSSPGDA